MLSGGSFASSNIRWDIMITGWTWIDIYVVEHAFDYFQAVVNGIDVVELVE
jgi:hypothetical protein